MYDRVGALFDSIDISIATAVHIFEQRVAHQANRLATLPVSCCHALLLGA